MIFAIIFVILYLVIIFTLFYIIDKQKQRIYELSDMNDSLYNQLELLKRNNGVEDETH